MVKCSSCNGTGKVAAFVDRRSGGEFDPNFKCGTCDGTGELSDQRADWIRRGDGCRSRRVVVAELSLRKAAVKANMTAMDMSSMEQGRADPAPLENFWRDKS